MCKGCEQPCGPRWHVWSGSSSFLVVCHWGLRARSAEGVHFRAKSMPKPNSSAVISLLPNISSLAFFFFPPVWWVVCLAPCILFDLKFSPLVSKAHWNIQLINVLLGNVMGFFFTWIPVRRWERQSFLVFIVCRRPKVNCVIHNSGTYINKHSRTQNLRSDSHRAPSEV